MTMCHLDWGSVPDWLAGLGTIGAVVVALFLPRWQSAADLNERRRLSRTMLEAIVSPIRDGTGAFAADKTADMDDLARRRQLEQASSQSQLAAAQLARCAAEIPLHGYETATALVVFERRLNEMIVQRTQWHSVAMPGTSAVPVGHSWAVAARDLHEASLKALEQVTKGHGPAT